MPSGFITTTLVYSKHLVLSNHHELLVKNSGITKQQSKKSKSSSYFAKFKKPCFEKNFFAIVFILWNLIEAIFFFCLSVLLSIFFTPTKNLILKMASVLYFLFQGQVSSWPSYFAGFKSIKNMWLRPLCGLHSRPYTNTHHRGNPSSSHRRRGLTVVMVTCVYVYVWRSAPVTRLRGHNSALQN